MMLKPDENGNVVIKDDEGKEHSLYTGHANIRLSVTAPRLAAASQLYMLDPTDSSQLPPMKERIHGVAKIDDDSLAILGQESPPINELQLSISAVPRVARGTSSGAPAATIGYSPRDWETGTSDEWWAVCYVPEDVFGHLKAALGSEVGHEISIGLVVQGMLCDTHPLVPISARRRWFFNSNPGRAERNGSSALGQISHVNITSIEPAASAAPEHEGAQDDLRWRSNPILEQPLPDAQSAVEIRALTAQVTLLMKAFKWASTLIAIGIFTIAFK